ncbi:metallophosphoesterase [Burkholderia sp. MBR-1]|uniref:metallophosphoesterase n=1 Tax=Burkholderia sp. MBR-1 TaxID=2732364 RepID=UPI0015EFC78B|nr:metallophosphoesterase [Burkholderia sp. MBR-1]QMI49794.1 metallophosphoesterase [Burkholderia sp. MBR-1]
MQHVQRFARNKNGRDFVVGDIHGCYDQVWEAMRAVDFKPEADRLFSLGDLLDRGPGSRRVRRFLEQPYVRAIRGNHDDEFVQLYAEGVPDDRVLQAYMNVIGDSNGMSWWLDVPHDERLQIVSRLARLPYVIELQTARGLVGLVHAEVPIGWDWATFTARISAGDEYATKSATWGRKRAERGDDSGVHGIDRMFVGHKIHAAPRRLGNVFYIDTGAFVSVLDPGREGHLTIADVAASTEVLTAAPMLKGPHVAAVTEQVNPDRPFGDYVAR